MSSRLGVRRILLSQTGSWDFIEKNGEVPPAPPPAFCSENDHLERLVTMSPHLLSLCLTHTRWVG